MRFSVCLVSNLNGTFGAGLAFVIWTVSFLCSANSSDVINKAKSLTYFTEIYPPSSFYQDNQLVGLSVDTLKLMWRDLGLPQQEIYVVPWARGLKQLNEHSNTVLFAMSKTSERTPMYQWVGPITEVNYVLVAPKKIAPIKNIQQISQYNIVVIRNDITEILVRESGANESQIVTAKDVQQSINLFKTGRVQLVALSRSSFYDAINTQQLAKDRYHEIFLLKVVGDYFAFSKDTPNDVIDYFQNGLEAVRDKQKAIIKTYDVTSQ